MDSGVQSGGDLTGMNEPPHIFQNQDSGQIDLTAINLKLNLNRTQTQKSQKTVIEQPKMKFKAPRGDADILANMKTEIQIMDTEYREKTTWPVREVVKEKHLGGSYIR